MARGPRVLPVPLLRLRSFNLPAFVLGDLLH
jgi:hypothetical protein